MPTKREEIKTTLNLLKIISQFRFNDFNNIHKTIDEKTNKRHLKPFGIEQTAKLSNISSATIRRLEKKGSLPPPNRNEMDRRVYSLKDINLIRDIVGTRYTRPAGSLPLRVSIVNPKSGTAKTTTAVHLSQFLALKGLKVLLVDLGTQATASKMFGISQNPYIPSYDGLSSVLMEYDFEQAIRRAKHTIKQTHWSGLDLTQLQSNITSLDMDLNLKHNHDSFNLLRELLTSLEVNYDVVIIDSPSDLGILSINAIAAADYIILPIPSDLQNIASLNSTFKILSKLSDYINIVDISVLITHHKPSLQCNNTSSLIKAAYGINVLTHYFDYSIELEKSCQKQQSLYEFFGFAHSKRELTTQQMALDDLNNEIFHHMLDIWDTQQSLST